jgi:hypothetical protein
VATSWRLVVVTRETRAPVNVITMAMRRERGRDNRDRYAPKQVQAAILCNYNNVLRSPYGGRDDRAGGDDFAAAGGPAPPISVHIPEELAGGVIGKGGNVISDIRKQSGARVQMDHSERHERLGATPPQPTTIQAWSPPALDLRMTRRVRAD